MKRFLPVLAAASFAFAGAFAYAQTPPSDAGKGPGMMGPAGGHRMMKPCSQEADPAKCEATRKEFRDNMKQAYEACTGDADKRGCMTQKMCAKAADPAKCQANAKERHARTSKRMDERQKAAEACTGKRGDELMKCMQDQRPKGKPEAHDHK
jgi:Spy/CpxP family protein refolding chaperone